MRRALVLGVTGLVGRQLLQQLLREEGAEAPTYGAVRALLRRPTGLHHPRLEECLIDLAQPQTWATAATGGDVLFSALGTTRSQAGGKAAQYAVDFTGQLQVAEAAAAAGCAHLVLVSSMGADARSWLFYSRMKGALDEAVQALPFRWITLLRPSLLEGERATPRLGEGLALHASRALGGMLGAYRHISAVDVAAAMRAADASREGAPRVRTFTGEEVHALAAQAPR